MCIGASTIDFSIVNDEVLNSESDVNATGLYYSPESDDDLARILIGESLVTDPERLLAVIAHELAHEVLRLSLPHVYGEPDMENCTDMVPAMFGLGVFLANATIRDVSETTGLMYHWSCSQSGYLNSQAHGYILALFARVRDEQNPAWATHLRPDARGTLKPALKFLRKTDDCLIDSDFRQPLLRNLDADELSQRLKSSSYTRQMYSLLQLESRPEVATGLQSEIAALLRSPERDIVVQAIRTLDRCEPRELDTHHELLVLRSHDKYAVRYEFIATLRPGSPDDELTVATLVALLSGEDLSVASRAAAMLAAFDLIPESVFDLAIDLLKRMFPAGANFQNVFVLLHAIDSNFETRLEELFEDDPDWMAELDDQLEYYHRTVDSPDTDENQSPSVS